MLSICRGTKYRRLLCRYLNWGDAFLKERMESIFSPLPAEVFAEEPALQAVSQCFGMEVIEKNALNENVLLCKALGGLLHYLEETQKSSLGSLNTLYIYQHGQYMELNLTLTAQKRQWVRV